jgi:hypothetical protein
VHASVAAPRLCCPAVAVAVGRILSPAPRLSFCLRHALPFLGIALPWPEIMESLLGLLKVRVVRGVNLAICDPLTHSSDPYVVLRLGSQVVRCT